MKKMALLFLCLMPACSQKVPESSYEINGTLEERIAEVTEILSKTAPLPSLILDAHFIGERRGDGWLGPSDFRSFCAITVAPADLPAWRAALSKSKSWNNHFANDEEIRNAGPKKTVSWWVQKADLDALELYSPYSLTGRSNGWVGIALDGRIFVFSFTQ